tara:strand:- start:947 stop:1393 length:447 start_codon:yes stop_codon:yes gene_type:complete
MPSSRNYDYAKYEQDKSYGVSQEDRLLCKIQQKYANVQKTSKHDKVDYVSNDYIIELKSRRCRFYTYKTTMISKGKIDYILETCAQLNKKGICMFNFDDGLYEVEITPDVVDKFECGFSGRKDRGRKEYDLYYFIPIEMLKIFEFQKS